jgi:hypothetical protein
MTHRRFERLPELKLWSVTRQVEEQQPLAAMYTLAGEEQRQRCLIAALRNNAALGREGALRRVDAQLLLDAADEIERLKHHPAMQLFGSPETDFAEVR